MRGQSKSPARASVVRITTVRLALVSVAVIILQMLIVTVVTKLNTENLVRNYVYWETRILRAGLRNDASGLSFELPANAQYYVDAPSSAYAFRILGDDGYLIAGSNTQLLARISPWAIKISDSPDSWVRLLAQGAWMHLAGGERFHAHQRDIVIEVATLGDPAGVHWRDVIFEIAEDVLIPTIPLIVLLLSVATLSIRWSLRPLVKAAEHAETITELGQRERFDLADMPLEAASFASAINRLLDRVSGLAESQDFVIARAAHEIRTPLSIMVLELGKMNDARARRLEHDVRAMSESVDHLLTLARLKTLQTLREEEVDLVALTQNVATRMRPLVNERRQDLTVHTGVPVCTIIGDASVIREAIQSIIENAIKHTPEGTKIDVTVTPDREIRVEDNGPGLPSANGQELFQAFHKGGTEEGGWGLGLAIAKRAAELHGGAIELGRSTTGGALFVLTFGRRAVPR